MGEQRGGPHPSILGGACGSAGESVRGWLGGGAAATRSHLTDVSPASHCSQGHACLLLYLHPGLLGFALCIDSACAGSLVATATGQKFYSLDHSSFPFPTQPTKHLVPRRCHIESPQTLSQMGGDRAQSLISSRSSNTAVHTRALAHPRRVAESPGAGS